MMTVGWRSLPIAKLRLPGDWKKTLDDPSVPAHAESQKLVGIIHEPVVRESDMRLIVGRRRVAGALYAGETDITFKVVECTNEEAELLALFENAYRENMSSEDQKRMVDLIAEKVAILRTERGKETILEPGRKKGRLKLPRTVARELIQQATGRTKEAQRKAEQRVAEQHKELAEKVDHDADIGIRSPWVDISPEFRKATNDVVKMTHETSQLLSRALGRLTLLAESGLPLHVGRLNRTREELASVAKAIRGMIPTSLCPFCKGVEEAQENCGGCFGSGYITQNQEAGVPAELWEAGENAVVMLRGKAVPYEKFFEPPSGASLNVYPEAEEAIAELPTENPYIAEDDDPNFGDEFE